MNIELLKWNDLYNLLFIWEFWLFFDFIKWIYNWIKYWCIPEEKHLLKNSTIHNKKLFLIISIIMRCYFLTSKVWIGDGFCFVNLIKLVWFRLLRQKVCTFIHFAHTLLTFYMYRIFFCFSRRNCHTWLAHQKLKLE